jgi:hypothetical protein
MEDQSNGIVIAVDSKKKGKSRNIRNITKGSIK